MLFTSTSDDALTIDLPVNSNNLFGEDDLFSQDLMLSTNDECSFDAASIDIEGFLQPIEKRESGQVCKTRQQGSSSGKPPEPPEDPEDFLNSLPLFEPYEDAELHERLDICKPILVRDRNIPMCLIGLSELALANGQWFPDDNLVGCAPLDLLASRCPGDAALLCCKQASIDTRVNLNFEIPGLMAQSDRNSNFDRCFASECVDSIGFILTPFAVERHLPLPAAPSQTPH